ncbi:MAG: hypothetical protein OXE78_15320 [Gammaproteobacteria bacterium]|nr:hypothetical protein [Gammaproteobacteria bacterium]MCY4357409.1 hypothetical protein [Gammaproteobacteria bacterium]
MRLYGNQESSVWQSNPSLVHLLGISPLLAISDSMVKAIGLGTALLTLCLISACIIQSMSAMVRSRYRLLWYGIVLATVASLLMQLMQHAFLPLKQQLGIYGPLIACNFALLLKLDAYNKAESLRFVIADALRMGTGLLLALVLFSGLRELLVSGTVLYGWQLLLPSVPESIEAIISDRKTVFQFAELPSTAFIGLGLLVALLRKTGLLKQPALMHRSELPVQRARLTGKLNKT